MPKKTNILMIRHGEKPDSGKGLTVSGQERAQAYVIYFQNYTVQSIPSASPPGQIKLNYLFAAEDSSGSDRPYLTIAPLSTAIGLSIDAKHKDIDYQKLADDILQNSKYDNSNILICWHHGEILDLATALGVDASKLPPGANWPSHWPGGEYGWLLQLS
ncbi:MAG: hypothetical protein ACREC4_02955, partial [Methylocella sp.]